MSNNEIEMWSTLAMWFIGTMVFGATIGWYGFLYGFKLLDDYLHRD